MVVVAQIAGVAVEMARKLDEYHGSWAFSGAP